MQETQRVRYLDRVQISYQPNKLIPVINNIMAQITEEKLTYLELDDIQVILLLDTLKDIINNNGEIDCDLKDYLELDNNPYERLYDELLEGWRE